MAIILFILLQHACIVQVCSVLLSILTSGVHWFPGPGRRRVVPRAGGLPAVRRPDVLRVVRLRAQPPRALLLADGASATGGR